MASKKTLALLEVLFALTRYFEIVAEEESANEAEQSAEVPTNTPDVAEVPTVTEEEVSPFVEITKCEAENSDVREDTFLPTPVPELYDVVQPAPTMSAAEYAGWEQRTEEVMAKGHFGEMGELQDDLKRLGLNELVQKVAERFAELNIEQAQNVLADRDKTLECIKNAANKAEFEAFRRDISRVSDRLQKSNWRVTPLVEEFEGEKLRTKVTIAEIRNSFLMEVGKESGRIEAIEIAAENRRHEQALANEQREREQIRQALANELDKKEATRMHGLISRFQANIAISALEAAEDCYKTLVNDRLALIAHLKSEEKAKEVLHGAFISLQDLRQKKAEKKKNGSKARQLQRV